jgi:hypothetical protein
VGGIISAAQIIVRFAMIFALSFLLTCALVITLAFAFQPTEKRPKSEASDSNSAIQVKPESAIQVKPEATPIPPSSPVLKRLAILVDQVTRSHSNSSI